MSKPTHSTGEGIEVFKGDPLHFVTTWKAKIINFASNLKNWDKCGALGSFLPVNEYLRFKRTIPGIENPDLPYEAREAPVPPRAGPMAVFKMLRAQYDLQGDTDKAFRQFLSDHLSDDVIDMITPAGSIFAYMTTAAMWQALTDRYGTYTDADYKRNRTELLKPFDPSCQTISEFVAVHRRAHKAAENMGNPIALRDQFEYLSKSVEASPHFARVVTNWRLNRTMEQHTFELLGVALQAEESHEKQNRIQTTVTSGFATAVQTTKPKNNRKRSSVDPPREDCYCWTHGLCAHFGCDCKSKKPGHIDSATSDNKQGGATGVWSQTKAAAKRTKTSH